MRAFQMRAFNGALLGLIQPHFFEIFLDILSAFASFLYYSQCGLKVRILYRTNSKCIYTRSRRCGHVEKRPMLSRERASIRRFIRERKQEKCTANRMTELSEKTDD